MKWKKTAAALLLITGTLLFYSCSGIFKTHRQVMIITLDTTRADHIGCYGNKEVKTPNIDAFATDSVLFDRCYSVANTTVPSHTSIFTSLYMKDTGVEDNRSVLPDLPGFMPKLFKAAGYKTAGFTSAGHLSSVVKINQGFDEFFPCLKNERKAQETNSYLFDWLDKNKKDDFFVWVHYFDPHMRYEPPPPYDHMYNDTSNEVITPVPQNKEKLKGYGEYIDWGKDPEYYRNLYKGEISYMDEEIGRLFRKLKDLKIYKNMDIVIVADHGEGLGEHGVYFDHATLDYNIVRVPMLIKLKDSSSTGKREQLISSIDIYPTLLELVGIDVPSGIRGKSYISVLDKADAPWIRDKVFYQMKEQAGAGVTTRNYTFIEYFKVSPYAGTKLYDNVKDKNQVVNLVADYPQIADGLKKEVGTFLRDVSNGKTGAKISDKEFMQKLKALGYVQ